jgi:hypothetical protein
VTLERMRGNHAGVVVDIATAEIAVRVSVRSLECAKAPVAHGRVRERRPARRAVDERIN